MTDELTVKDVMGESKYDGLEQQIEAEFNRAWKHQKPKKDEQELRLKLYNNQKRDPEAVGDTTMFTIHQTILASLYDDRLMVAFEGREEGDHEVAENLGAMAEFDYDDMEKDKLDYDWDWDTLFFGRGLVDMSEYERDPENGVYIPLPANIDPIPFLRDIWATSVNGDRKGRGACGYLGSEIMMTEQEIEELPHRLENFRMTDLSHESGSKSLLRDAIEARNLAQNRQTQKMEGEAALKANAKYIITRWQTHFKIDDEVKKVKVWLANERSKIIGVQVLDIDRWQIIDRPLYPTAHDWDGTSIPDLTEDKQRARAVAQNLGLKAMTADLYPMYIYDSNKIVNRADLKFGYNKFIPVDAKGENLNSALVPMRKSNPNLPLLDFIYNSLDISAQKATATPEIQQGMMSEQQRTLGEVNIIASKVDTRYSLSAKIFGWSEKAFWQEWYRSYKENFKDSIDEKVIRLEGSFGAKWRPLGRENIIGHLDPDIKIESRTVNRAKEMEDRQSMTQYLGLAFQEPGTNRRYGLKKLGRLNGMEKDEIDRLYPMTIDEREAEAENAKLSEDEVVTVLREQDHNIHLLEHMKAADTPASRAHIKTHEEALTIKRSSPELFPEEPEAAAFNPPGSEDILPFPNMKEEKPIAPSQAPTT